MPSALLENVKQQIALLPEEEQSALLTYLTQTVENREMPAVKWSDLAGIAPYPLTGEDAQEWISRSRLESDRNIPR